MLTLRLIFYLALRQAEAFSRSVLACSASSWRSVLDSTGLQLFGQGEWDAHKHSRTRRQWRKLHIAVDADSGEIAARVLTERHVDDAVQAPSLLGQAEGSVATVTADGAYDSNAVYQAAIRQHGPPPDVVIPLRASAVPSIEDPAAQYPSGEGRLS